MDEITEVWFNEAKKLQVGQALFIRVADKKEQVKLANTFEEERDQYAILDPVHASQIFINKVLMERKQYVVLERKYRAIFTAFLRDENGVFSKVSLDPERRRMLTLMVKDKKSREEIESTLNGLTDEEILEFFPSN